MKLPVHCPFCKGIMVTEFEPIWEVPHKKCNIRLGHNIHIIANIRDYDSVHVVSIQLAPNTKVSWDLLSKTLQVIIDKKSSPLPFFEPNLTNFTNLVNKVKTYIVFS